MDGSRFDEIARTLAPGATRRQFLRAVAAIITGSTAFGAQVGSTVAQTSTVCFQDSDCLGDTTNPCSGASCVGGTCTFFIATCIPGYVCCDGECAQSCDHATIDPRCQGEHFPIPRNMCDDLAEGALGQGGS